MIRDAIELIQETTRKAQTPKIVEIPGNGRTCWVQVGESIETYHVDPPCRQHFVYALDDLIAAAELADDAGQLTVWHGLDQVILILNDADRRDRVTLPLEQSRAYKVLSSLDDDPRPLEQKAFVRLLRFDLGVDKADIAPWRRLEWTSSGKSIGEVEKARDRMGRDIAAEASGAGELPESMIVMVPVYEQKGCREAYPIRCDVEVAAAAQRIFFRPIPGELQVIVDRAQADIHQQLEQIADAKIFFGFPGCSP